LVNKVKLPDSFFLGTIWLNFTFSQVSGIMLGGGFGISQEKFFA
jgi:hypothetical protein